MSVYLGIKQKLGAIIVSIFIAEDLYFKKNNNNLAM